MGPPALGIGLTFHPELEAFLESFSDEVDVLEIEPQTLWLPAATPSGALADSGAIERLAAFPQRKLVHSVGTPVGGTRLGDPRQFPLLRDSIVGLDAPWCSEHLSFNVAGGPDGRFFTSFLLPCRQTAQGVECAVDSVRKLSAELEAPLAVETGVSYLQPRSDELRDGEFVAAVAEAADCGVLLDVHNIWTNERNGRQTVKSYLQDLPLDRVWELHLAGGEEHNGFWLDAHSGGIPDRVLAIAGHVLSQAPNVGALVFELMPEHVERLGESGLRRQLDALHRLWEGRTAVTRPTAASSAALAGSGQSSDACQIDPRTWEDTLGALAVGRAVSGVLADELLTDPGVEIVKTLVNATRAGMLTGSLKLTVRLLLLQLGQEGTTDLFRRFWLSAPPEPFAGDEAIAFGAFVRSEALAVPYLREALDFELAVVRAAISRRGERVTFQVEPTELLAALADGRLPGDPPRGNYELVVSAR